MTTQGANTTIHQPVLLTEVVEAFEFKDRDDSNKDLRTLLDCTLGSGGHSEALMKSNEDLFLFGLDRDPTAVNRSRSRLKMFSDRMCLATGDFANFPEILTSAIKEKDIHVPTRAEGPTLPMFNRILADLGISSDQLEDPQRGFSFTKDGPLDMRLDQNTRLTADEIVNHFPVERLEAVFKKGGVGPISRTLAREIFGQRPISGAAQLADLCSAVVLRHWQKNRSKPLPKKNPATVPFQALRIAVNQELESLRTFLDKAINYLAPGGRLAVISFHSLEDRIVTRKMRYWGRIEQVPRRLPTTAVETARGRLLSKQAIHPNEQEILRNPRARSARMRVFEKYEQVL